jgi:hypothetical protein
MVVPEWLAIPRGRKLDPHAEIQIHSSCPGPPSNIRQDTMAWREEVSTVYMKAS